MRCPFIRISFIGSGKSIHLSLSTCLYLVNQARLLYLSATCNLQLHFDPTITTTKSSSIFFFPLPTNNYPQVIHQPNLPRSAPTTLPE
jgi:hypothetical protein